MQLTYGNEHLPTLKTRALALLEKHNIEWERVPAMDGTRRTLIELWRRNGVDFDPGYLSSLICFDWQDVIQQVKGYLE